MSVLSEVFERCRAENRAALIGYYPAGYPTVEGSIEAVRTMVAHGCDVIEVGIPYSDPMMDGPTIQAAADVALEAGFRIRDTFAVIRAVAEAGSPISVVGYDDVVLAEAYDYHVVAVQDGRAGSASVPVTVEFWPEASSATANTTLAAPMPSIGASSACAWSISATSVRPATWKVAAARIRIAALMKKARPSAIVPSIVAIVTASRLPASVAANARVWTIDEWR